MQVHDRDDPIGRILGEMTDRLHAHDTGVLPRGFEAWRSLTGRRPTALWESHPSRAGLAEPPRLRVDSIRKRAWSALDALTTTTTRGSLARHLRAESAAPTSDDPARLVEFAALTRMSD